MDKFTRKVLFAILLLGAALRIWGISFGLPYQFHQDEPIIVNHALAYGTGDLNPHFFIIPPLTSYILFFGYGIYYILLYLFGMMKGVEAFAISFCENPAPFYLIGRIALGAIPSLLNIYLTYRLASEFCSKSSAVYAAFIMAVSFLNVINAHYIYTDNLLVMLILLALIAMAALIKKPDKKHYVTAGIFTGMAVATKYNAALLLGPFLCAHIISCGYGIKKMLIHSGKALIFAAMAVLSFIICNPYSVLDWRAFIANITKDIWPEYTGWAHHITHSMFEGLGALLTIFGIGGLFIILCKNFKKNIFLVSFPALFYLHLVFRSQLFSRYALPMIPFISIGIGFLLFDHIGPKLKFKRHSIALLIISSILPLMTIAKSFDADILFARKDTRIEAAEWIRENVPFYSKIALDHTFFRPPLNQTLEQLKEKESILDYQPELSGLKRDKLRFQIMAHKDKNTYEVYYIIRSEDNAGQFLVFWPVILNALEQIKLKGVQYIVINNMTLSADMLRFHEELRQRCDLVAEFSPYLKSGYRRSFDEIEGTCIPLKTKELFSRKSLGPYLQVYKIK